MKTLIIALGTLFLFSMVSFSQPKQKFHKRDFKENIIEKLNLTEEQKDKISDLRTSHQKEMIDLKADLQKKIIDMRELHKNQNLTRKEMLSAVESINTIKNQISIAKVNHGMDMFELLTAEQKKIWQEHKPFRDHMKMKFKERRFGHNEFGFNEFDPEPLFDNDEEESEVEVEN